MNTQLTTCSTCAHFDALHGCCPNFTITQPIGKVYLKRLPESPVCRTEYLPKQDVKEETCSNNVELFSQ